MEIDMNEKTLPSSRMAIQAVAAKIEVMVMVAIQAIVARWQQQQQ